MIRYHMMQYDKHDMIRYDIYDHVDRSREGGGGSGGGVDDNENSFQQLLKPYISSASKETQSTSRKPNDIYRVQKKMANGPYRETEVFITYSHIQFL